MKIIKIVFVLIISAVSISFFLSNESFGQSRFPSYYSANQFGLTSPGAMRYGLYGYVNPAELSSLDQGDLLFTFSDQNGSWNDFNHWGISAAVPHVGFGIVHQKDLPGSVTDYKLSFGFGNKEVGVGFGYGWSRGDFTYVNRSDLFTFGLLYRPITYLSFGFVGNVPAAGNSEGALDFAVRPFGNEKLSLFGDYVFANNRNPDDIRWSAGAAVEAFPGIRITGRYFDTKIFTIGAELSLGNIGIFTNTNFDKNGNHGYNVYGIRAGGYDRNPFIGLIDNTRYVDLNLLGETKYQKYILFDNSNTLLNLIKQIEAAKDDNSVSGIAINTSGMKINRELLWELRKKLEEFKSTGKHVVVYIDNAGIDDYHFASVADKIVIDPLGMISLEGFLWGRNYYKGTLEKLGIGFHEWRYFKFKSAMEAFSQDSMSQADKIQLQALVDEYYKQAKDDICLSRNIGKNKFDDFVNNFTLFDPAEALKYGLADTIGRWDKVKDLIKEIEGKDKSMISPYLLTEFHLPEDNYWGEKPEIAVIYAIGECAMDAGINARNLVKDVERVTNDSRIKAVVFRVDSPGGDALASDIVAEALKKCRDKKPVIVSQGFVAASGGYWLSMFGDTIVAAPTTITGSIGVIGGWFYNSGLKNKLGVSTGFVKKGEHADLPMGMHIPIIGLTLPDRDLTADEQNKIDNLIKSFYNEFVLKVAAGRRLSVDSVNTIAQGRVWSGDAGLKNGLVDVSGGLSDAISIAVEKAGLKNKQYKLVEYPAQPLINLNFFMPSIFGVKIQSEDDPVINNIKFRFEHNGEVMPILPLEDMDMILYK